MRRNNKLTTTATLGALAAGWHRLVLGLSLTLYGIFRRRGWL